MSKEEIEKAKGWLSALDIKSEFEAILKETLLQYIEELEKNNKFLKEWNDYDNEELRKRNGKARRILSKMKNVKEIDILNMGEEEVWNEIEKSFINGSDDNDK